MYTAEALKSYRSLDSYAPYHTGHVQTVLDTYNGIHSSIPSPGFCTKGESHEVPVHEKWDHVSFGAHSLSRPVHYYKIAVRVCMLHNVACYSLLYLLL